MEQPSGCKNTQESDEGIASRKPSSSSTQNCRGKASGPLLSQAAAHMNEGAVLVLEIGNEREHFERAFPRLEAYWPETSAGVGPVVLLTREALQGLVTA